MSRVYLCHPHRALRPYYFDDLDINIYSAEELCFLLITYVPLLSEEFFGRRLIRWLSSELKMHRLARILTSFQEKGTADIETYVFAVLSDLHYLDAAGQEALTKEIRRFEELPLPGKKKKRADVLISCKKYMRGLEGYKDILRMGKTSHLGIRFTGSIYHNMAVAYAGLFQMEEAISCLKNAWEILMTQEALRDYLIAVYMKDSQSYRKLADDLGLDKDLRAEFENDLKNLKPRKRPADLSRQLDFWVTEYHKETRT